CLAAYAFYNGAVTAAQMSYSRNSPEAILLPVTGGVLAYGQLRVLRDRVSLVRVLAAVLLAHAMVMGLKALGAEGLNGAVLEAQPLVRYAAIGNALMFDW